MEFQDLGKRCSEEICHQQDFLPYKCTFCEQIFCHEHFRPEAHECKSSNKFAKKAIVCPFCLQTIKYQGSQDENEALDIHQATECEPANRARVLKEQQKVICESGKKCKTRLSDLNTYVCKNCNRQLCLKCRMPEDHVCQKLQRNKEAKQIQQIEQKFQQVTLDKIVASGTNVVGGNIANSRQYNPNAYQQQLDQRVERQQAARQNIQQQQQTSYVAQQNQQNNIYPPQQQYFAQTQVYNGGTNQTNQQRQQIQTAPAREICDVCGKSFVDFMELFAHAESTHQNNTQANLQQEKQSKEICEVCGQSFVGFERLLEHAEQTHFVQSN